MITTRQRKGVVLGIIWSFISWIPFYTKYLSGIRSYVGIPAALGLNLELALNRGDAFVFSILLGSGIGFFTASLLDFFTKSVKIIGLFQAKGKKLSRRGL